MGRLLLLALTQAAVLALYHFGEADLFWTGLLAWWAEATWGKGV